MTPPVLPLSVRKARESRGRAKSPYKRPEPSYPAVFMHPAFGSIGLTQAEYDTAKWHGGWTFDTPPLRAVLETIGRDEFVRRVETKRGFPLSPSEVEYLNREVG